MMVMHRISHLNRPVETVKMFLDFEADPLLKDNLNKSAFGIALNNACPEVILLMVENESILPALKASNPSAESMEIVNMINTKIATTTNFIACIEAEQAHQNPRDSLRKRLAIRELKKTVAVLESPKKQSELVVEVQQKIRTALCPQYSVDWLKNREIGFKRNLPKKSAISSDAADFEQKEN